MNKEEERLISYNYNELGQEFGDLIVDIRNERDKYKELLDKIKEKINELKKEHNKNNEIALDKLVYNTLELNEILELLEEIE